VTFQIRNTIVRALTAAMVIASSSGLAFAQERLVSGMTLKKSYIKSNSAAIMMSDVMTEGLLTPTVVTCPKGGTCALRVDFSSVVFVQAGSLQMGLYVDDELVEFLAGFDYVADSLTSQVGGTRSFIFLYQGLTPGEHSVEVKFIGGQFRQNSWFGSRTIAIEVLRP
jgi:hypothetical protein